MREHVALPLEHARRESNLTQSREFSHPYRVVSCRSAVVCKAQANQGAKQVVKNLSQQAAVLAASPPIAGVR